MSISSSFCENLIAVKFLLFGLISFGPSKSSFAPLISIMVSCAYVVFKLVVSREENTGVLLQRVQYTFCLVQYAVNILMLVLIKKHYEKKENEQGEKEEKMEKPQRPTVISLETDEGYGIDSIDDLIE